MIDIELLKKICEIPGAPGFEQEIRSFLLKQMSGLSYEVKTDSMGNVIAFKKGTSDQRLMCAAHMDEISYIVTHVDDEGFIRFQALGGFDPKTLTAQRVFIHGDKTIPGVMASKPVHIMSPEEKRKSPEIRDFFIDTGLPKDELLKYIGPGAPVTRERTLIEMGDCVNSKSLDNRVSVFILLECLKNLDKAVLPMDFYAVFTVQEEMGLRGATVATSSIQPDFGIALDTTIAYDLPGAQAYEVVTRLGKGPAIKIMDSMVISDYRMVNFMKSVATENNIPYQLEILQGGGTDTAALQRSGKGGAISGCISIPTRHLHQVIEMVHKSDIRDAINLMQHCIMSMPDFDWQFR